MIKVTIYDWAGKCKKTFEKLGYEHNQTLLFDGYEGIFMLMENFFNEGLNVALIHKEDGVLFAVDNKAFKCR